MVSAPRGSGLLSTALLFLLASSAVLPCLLLLAPLPNFPIDFTPCPAHLVHLVLPCILAPERLRWNIVVRQGAAVQRSDCADLGFTETLVCSKCARLASAIGDGMPANPPPNTCDGPHKTRQHTINDQCPFAPRTLSRYPLSMEGIAVHELQKWNHHFRKVPPFEEKGGGSSWCGEKEGLTMA